MNIQPPKEFPLNEVVEGIEPMPTIKGTEFIQSTYAYDAVERLLRVKEAVRKYGWSLEIAYSVEPVADQTMIYPIDDHLDPKEWMMWMGKALIMIDEVYKALNIHHNLLAVGLMGCATLPKGARKVESMILKKKGSKDVRPEQPSRA